MTDINKAAERMYLPTKETPEEKMERLSETVHAIDVALIIADAELKVSKLETKTNQTKLRAYKLKIKLKKARAGLNNRRAYYAKEENSHNAGGKE